MPESKIDLEAVRRKAMNHDIRVAANIAEKEQADKKRESILTYKKDLLARVEEHMEDLDRAEHAHENLGVFKDELMKTVHDHMEEVERADHAHGDLAKFKTELSSRVIKFKAESFGADKK